MSHNYYSASSNSILGHCSFGVSDITSAKNFYDATFKAFGVDMIYESSDGKVLGYGFSEHEPFTIFQRTGAKAHGPGTHLAFNAPSREAVDKFYEAALANGGKGDGAAGLRPEIHANYYCCFVYDPDGHRLEAVFQDEPVLTGKEGSVDN